ncbi:MAG: hypothetical protein WBP13_10110 [Methylophilaceae bacterium]
MNEKRANCPQHGNQGIGLLCIHAAIAMDSGENVGFFTNDNTDLTRPDAWCAACEQQLAAEGWSEEWFESADFKILCACCWDIAQQRLSAAASDDT